MRRKRKLAPLSTNLQKKPKNIFGLSIQSKRVTTVLDVMTPLFMTLGSESCFADCYYCFIAFEAEIILKVMSIYQCDYTAGTSRFTLLLCNARLLTRLYYLDS